jgi:hypothetical protein
MRWIPPGVNLLLIMMAPLMAQEVKLPPGLVSRANESVDVNLDSSMLQFAVKFLSDRKPDEAEAKKLLTGLKAIYVKSLEFDKPGAYSAADLESIRAQFRGPGWSRMASVESKKDGENAEVFVKLEKDGKMSGLGVVAAEAKELTVVSIVGIIDPEQLSELSGKFGIPKIELEQKKKSGKDD